MSPTGFSYSAKLPREKLRLLNQPRLSMSLGVLAVITHRNVPKATLPDDAKGSVDPSVGTPLPPLQNDIVHYHGQPIAVVVADSFGRGHAAAPLSVRATVKSRQPMTSLLQSIMPFPEGPQRRENRAPTTSAAHRIRRSRTPRSRSNARTRSPTSTTTQWSCMQPLLPGTAIG